MAPDVSESAMVCPGATFVVGADVLTRRSQRIRHFRTGYNSCLAGLATWSCEGAVGNLTDAMNQNSDGVPLPQHKNRKSGEADLVYVCM